MTKLPVFYDPRMVAPEQCSPSAAKPVKVFESWQKLGFPIEQMEVGPATREEFKLVHSPKYVDAVLDLKRDNGFGTRDREVARSLHFTSGSLLSAALYAVTHKTSAASPTSGFHHAGYGYGGGFCTFNGLALAAAVLRAAGLVDSVAIIDCDMHYGDGTDDIIETLGLDYISHFTAGAFFHSPEDAATFFGIFPQVCELTNAADLVIYQAGADPHVDDPLGGWLTTDELRRRDAIVFEKVKKPLVWNLAGGYQREKDGSIPKVLEIHDNTMREWALSLDL